MAYASITYTSASGTTFALTNSEGDPIPYLRQADITVTVNGTALTQGTGYTFNAAGTAIVLASAVSGATVIISRSTSIADATVVYTAGSTLTAQDLNNADNQIRYGLQEFSDTYAALTTGTGDLQALGGFIGSSETWVSDNAHAATTGAIDGRVDSKIDTALTTDVVAGNAITITDNSPSSGQITVAVTNGAIETAELADGAVTTAKILDANVTTAKILDSNVTTAKLNDAAVTTAKLANDSVTSAKIADGTIIAGDLANDAVTTAKILDANVTTAKIADLNVTTAKIADSSITSAKIVDGTIVAGDLASDSVTTAKILDSNVTTVKIADANVTTAKLADSSVTSAKIADGTIVAGDLASNSVTTAKIVDANVTTDKLADSSVTAAKIADGVITSAKLSASTVVTAAEQSGSTPDDATFFTTSASDNRYDARYVNVTGDTMSGALAMGNNKITGLGTPTASTDASTKGYVDATVAAGTIADADYGDITVSGTGTVWTIDNGAVTSAKIADGTIVNADVNASAAIAGTKISPDFGSQTVQTTGVISHALGTAGAPTVTFTGDTNTGIYSPGADQVAISTNGSGRLFVDASGNVGLGTSTPDSNSVLDARGLIYAGNGTIINQIGFSVGNSTAVLGARSNHGVELRTNNTERLRITSTGALNFVGAGTAGSTQAVSFNGSAPVNSLVIDSTGKVGVGTSSPGTQVVVEGNGNTYATISLNQTATNWNSKILFAEAGTEKASIDYRNSTWGGSQSSKLFITNNSNSVVLDSSGNVGIGTSAPGARIHSVETSAAEGLRVDGAAGGFSLVVNGGTGRETRIKQASIGNSYVASTPPTDGLIVQGSVGIGTASPTSLGTNVTTVEVQGAATTRSGGIRLSSSDSSQKGAFYIYDGAAVLGTETSHPLGFYVGNTPRATIDTSGRLLVGTPTARSNIVGDTAAVQIEGTTYATSSFSIIRNSNSAGTIASLVLGKSRGTATGANTIVQSGDSVGEIYFAGADGTNFQQAATIRGEIDSTPGANTMPGRLVFSTTPDSGSSPVERLRIVSDGSAYFGIASAPTGAANGVAIADGRVNTSRATTASTTHLNFYNTNGAVGSISTSGSSTVYSTSSDYRLKENVIPLTGAADRLNQLQVHRFNFIADPDTTVDGFIAHEAQAVVPECVTGTKDEVDDEGNPVYQGIDQSKLVPLLTAALQEALAEIESLKARVTALEP